MPDPLRILEVCIPAEFGGMERVVELLCSGLAARGHEIHLAVALQETSPDPPFVRALAAEGVPIHRIPLRGRSGFRELLGVARLLRDLRPHVLHTHGYRPDLLHPAWARSRGVATVTTLHSARDRDGAPRLFELLQGRALQHMDGVVAVSSEIRSQVRLECRVAPQRVRLIPNASAPPGVPLERDRARAELQVGDQVRGPLLGWAGRLVRIKGLDIFLHALSRVNDLDWTAVILGDGPERAESMDLASELGISRRVIFSGHVSAAHRLFSGFDLIVQSSRSEGTPMTLLEAMGAGCPVVATPAGGVPALMGSDPPPGWVSDAVDPEALATVLREAISSPRERRRRGSAGTLLMEEKHALRPWLDGYDALFRDVVRRRN